MVSVIRKVGGFRRNCLTPKLSSFLLFFFLFLSMLHAVIQ